MSERICITLPSSGQRVCFDIPLLLPRKWWDPNPPDPVVPITGLVDGPLPDPWLHGANIKVEASRDLRVLASLHAVSTLLSSGIRDVIQETIGSQARRLALPDDVEVRFEQPRSKG